MAIEIFKGATLKRAQQKAAASGDPLVLAVRDLGAEGVELLCKTDSRHQVVQRLHPGHYAGIVKILAWHGVSAEMTEYILDQIDSFDLPVHLQDPQRALQAALENLLPFSSGKMPDDDVRAASGKQLFILVGSPGQGKTTIAVKLALAARLQKIPVALVAGDQVRLGAVQQLQSYADKLTCPMYSLTGLEEAIERHQLCLVDAPAVNPAEPHELAMAGKLVDYCLSFSVQVTPLLALGTLTCRDSALRMVSQFAAIKVRNMIATFQDIEQRLGAILEIVWRQQIRLFAYSPRPEIANGLRVFSAKTLTDLLFAEPPSKLVRFAPAPVVPAAAVPVAPASPAVPAAVPVAPASPIAGQRQPANWRSALHPQIIAVASGKGGVGKTFLSIQLAIATALRNKKVLLFDGDLGLANIDIQLNLRAATDIVHVVRQGQSLAKAIVRSPFANLDVLAGRSGSTSLAALPSGEVQRLANGLAEISENYDSVIADLGAGIDRPVQLLAALATDVAVVMTDEPTSLADAYALIKILYRQNSIQRRSVIVTQATSVRAGMKAFQALKQTCESFLGFPLLLAGIVAKNSRVPESIRTGVPLAQLAPGSQLWKTLQTLAATLESQATSAVRTSAGD